MLENKEGKDAMNASHRIPAVAALSVLLSACATQPAGQADKGWQFNGGYDATRFSPLTQINTGNVASLQEVGRFRIPETMSFQSDAVVAGDTLYVTTRDSTYAM